MPIIPVVAFITGAVVAGPLGRRLLPVTKAAGQAGLGVAAAVLTGAGEVAFAIWHGEPLHDAPAA